MSHFHGGHDLRVIPWSAASVGFNAFVAFGFKLDNRVLLDMWIGNANDSSLR